jgi:hypothetical protein
MMEAGANSLATAPRADCGLNQTVEDSSADAVQRTAGDVDALEDGDV